MQEVPYHNQQPPQAKSTNSEEYSNSIKLPTSPATSLDNIIIQATPEAEHSPSWFRGAVQTLSDAWFDPKSFESPEVYKKLGIETFKKYHPFSGDLVMRLIWKKLGAPAFIQGKESLKSMVTFTKFSEAGHMALFGYGAYVIGEDLAHGDIGNAVFHSLAATLVTVYPVMLSRYNRIRLYRTINRLEEKKNSSRTV